MSTYISKCELGPVVTRLEPKSFGLGLNARDNQCGISCRFAPINKISLIFRWKIPIFQTMVTTLVIWVVGLFPFFGATNSHGISPQLIMLALRLRNTRNATSFSIKKLFWCWAALFWFVSFQLSFNMLCRKELMVRKQMKHFSYLFDSSSISLPTSHSDLAWQNQMCYLLSFDPK